MAGEPTPRVHVYPADDGGCLGGHYRLRWPAHTAATAAAIKAAQTVDTNDRTIRQRLRNGLDANTTFLALASPTNVQTLAQVRALTRENTGLIRLALDALDAADGT